jgi:branched-chain amino acid transport system permease protein
MRETLLTLGINLIIGDVLLAAYGGVPQSITAAKSFRQSMNLGFVSYPRIRLFILLIAIAEGIGLFVLINKTHIGQYIRAGVNDKKMASALGININMVFTIVFLIGGLLAGISGVMGGSYLAFNPGFDSTILTYSLVVVIVGGIGSLGGAALGSALVGLIDSYTKATVPNLSMVIIFGVLMLVLAFKPNGLLGREG